MSHDDKYDEGIADIKEQIRQIEANQAEDFDGSCTAVIIDMPHAKAILARHSALSAIGETQAPSGMAMLMDSAPTVQEAINETMARRRAESPVSHDADSDLPGMLAVAKGVAEQQWPHTMDAAKWSEEFVKRYPSMDEGTMISWFANAIMAGYDTASARSATGDTGLDGLQAAWDAVNGLIRPGELSGNGCDATAQRNGLILATNVIHAMIATRKAKMASAERTANDV